MGELRRIQQTINNIKRRTKITCSSRLYKQSSRRERSSACNACLRRTLTEAAVGGLSSLGAEASLTSFSPLNKSRLSSLSPIVGSLWVSSTRTPSLSSSRPIYQSNTNLNIRLTNYFMKISNWILPGLYLQPFNLNESCKFTGITRRGYIGFRFSSFPVLLLMLLLSGRSISDVIWIHIK